MTSHDWYVEHRASWVARALDTEEARSFADHLKRCPECREAVAELERDLSWLPLGVAPVAPRPGFRRDILDRIVGARRHSRWGWVVPAALAASLLISLGVIRGQHQRLEVVSGELANRDATLAALRDTLSVEHDAAQVVHASFAAAGKACNITIIADPHTHRWNVVVHGLPPANAGETYQFWFITDDGMRRGVAIDAVTGRVASFVTDMPPGNAKVMGAALSIERAESRGGPMKGTELTKIMM